MAILMEEESFKVFTNQDRAEDVSKGRRVAQQVQLLDTIN